MYVHVYVAGWTQAINTLGLCANPSEAQLRAEKPVLQRPTRGTQNKYARKGEEVVKVMVFKGAAGKAAVIRAAYVWVPLPVILFRHLALAPLMAACVLSSRVHASLP